MKNIFIICCLLACCGLSAQEQLGSLGYNPKLYYSQAGHHSSAMGKHKQFVIVDDSTTLVESDTLSLPFSDDFTYPTLKPFDYSSYIYATVYNAIGPCDTYPVRTVTDTFSFSPTYTYTFDVALQKVDTIPNAPIVFLNSPITGECFANLGDTAILYPIGYVNVFDSATGGVAAQTRDPGNVLVAITYAPVLYRSRIPAYTKWLDNSAYQNNSYGYLPPSIGVVTLDGLASDGQPYNKSQPTNEGVGDVLTSKPINLGGLNQKDSVYLSFFYQPGGFGDDPSVGDSLVVEFYNGYTNHWDHIWSVTGDSVVPTIPDPFRQVLIQVDSFGPSDNKLYLFNGFHFRFRNYGSLTGNNDVWNIDYVRLDKNRTIGDTSINDIAFQYEYPSILKNYTQMPAEQFTGAADLADSITLYIDNLNPAQALNNPPATNYTLTANQTYPVLATVLAPVTNTFNAGLQSTILLLPSTQYTVPAVAGDSVVINSQAVLNVTDLLGANDTVTQTQTLSNTLAYDDGSAEATYGVFNLGTNKFAYDFTLNRPDTLVGFQVLFGNTDVDVHDLVFEYSLWYNIDTDNIRFIDTPVYTSNNQVAFYIDSTNGFATYRIPGIPLPTHFYFGYAQTDVRNLQIGYDLNSAKGRPHMYIYTSRSGLWEKSTLGSNGSPMIRLLLGHSYQQGSGIKNVGDNMIKAYPNPTSGLVTFELPEQGGTYELAVYNMLGQLSASQRIDDTHNSTDMSHLEQGVYLLRLTDSKTGISYQNKIVRAARD